MSVEKRRYMQSRDIILAGEITTVVMQHGRQKPQEDTAKMAHRPAP